MAVELPDAAPRTLTEACAPVFVYLTAFRRNAESSGLDVAELQSSLLEILDGVRRRCEDDAHLKLMLERAWYALVAAVDQIVLSSSWAQRSAWAMNLLEMRLFGSAEGGRRFFLIVEQTANDAGTEAAELAELLHACLCLGFQGELAGQHAELERRKRRLYEKAKLGGRIGEELTPEAYGRNESRSLRRLPTVGLLRLAVVALAALLFAWLWGNGITAYKNRKVTDRAQAIVRDLQEAPAAQPSR